MQIKLKKLHIQNFKGCNEKIVEFREKTNIKGENATGKTTLFDAFTWLLFGKDSLGNTAFDIRPLDSEGKMINNVEISVEATISVGEDEYILKKIQKQIWRKKRGTNVTEFQGNKNEFEINGYPKSENEFKEFVAGFIDEKIFNLVTNPNTFNFLPWKEQREILMKFAGNFSNVEIAQQFGDRFLKLIPELKIASTEDILRKYAKVKNMLNRELVEIPARIDEVSKQLVIVDVRALEVEKAAKEVELKKVEDELLGGAGQLEEIIILRDEIVELKMKLSNIQNIANEELAKRRNEVRAKYNKADDEFRDIYKKIDDLLHEKNDYIRQKHSKEIEKNNLIEEWKSEKAKVFPEFIPLEPYVEPESLKESDLVCQTCGQDLPLPKEVKQKRIADHKAKCERLKADYEARIEAHEKKYKKDRTEFEQTRKENLKRITELGKKATDDIKELQGKIENIGTHINSLNANLDIARNYCSKFKNELNEIPSVADVSGNTEYKSVQERIFSLEKQIQELSKESTDKTELEVRKTVIKDDIAEIEIKIKAADNSKIKERIAELEEEKKKVGQKLAEQEQMIDLTEDFIRIKMNMISEKINEKFKLVSFKLFDNQINGGLKETCECTVNGVPYKSLNNGMRVCAGLDIVQSLSNLYGVSCPVFIDNSESVNADKFPKMDAQMIHLLVTSDKELKIEGSENN